MLLRRTRVGSASLLQKKGSSFRCYRNSARRRAWRGSGAIRGSRSKLANKLLPLAEDKGSSWWKAFGMMEQGWLLALTGKTSDAAPLIASGITLFRSIG